MRIFLSLLFALLLTSNVFAQEKDSLNVKDFSKGIKKERPVILDVRRPEEYAEGHIKKAVNINWQNQEEFVAKVSQLHKSEPVYVYCRSGVRSARAVEWLRSNGFTQVVGLSGGMKAWVAADKRVVNKDKTNK